MWGVRYRPVRCLISGVAVASSIRWKNIDVKKPSSPRKKWPPGTIGSVYPTVADFGPTVGELAAAFFERRKREQADEGPAPR